MTEPTETKESEDETAPETKPEKQPKYNVLEAALLGLDVDGNRIPRPPRLPGPTLKQRWKNFRGEDSPATVTFGCVSVLTTIILAWATITLASTSNDLLDRQNDLILTGSQPAVTASLLPTGEAGFVLNVENAGPRASFRSIEPMTFLRFTFEKYDGDMEDGYVAVYDVFEDVEAGQGGTGLLAEATSVPQVSTRADQVCVNLRAVDDRINECVFEVFMVIHYQTNTEDIYPSYFRFEDEVSVQVPGGELQRQVDRWDDGPNDRTAFTMIVKPSDSMFDWVNDYVDERAEQPPFGGF